MKVYNRAISSMIAHFTEKYWTPEHYRHTIIGSSDTYVHNMTKWDAKSNAGEKNFSYIYLEELTTNTYERTIVDIYFTYEKIAKLEKRD